MAKSDVESAIDRVLNDPMTKAIMRADRVDRDALRQTLRAVAAERAPFITKHSARRWSDACCGEAICAW